MQAKRISILGVGLLGGSIGLALKSRPTHYDIIGYGHRPATIEAALAMGALDEGYTDLASAVDGAEMVILCTPVGLFRPLLTQLAPLLPPRTIVTDVGSTKRSIVAAAEELLAPGVHFVGSHPMAGSEKHGVQFARVNLYENALCILTPTARTDPGALRTVERFWIDLGMRTRRVSPEEHDRRLADVSHLPHTVAAALVALQESASADLAGKGFHDMTRIAGGDGVLWRDILLDNRDNVRQSIERLRRELDAVVAMLDAADGDRLRFWLDEAAEHRQRMLETRKPGGGDET